MILQPRADDLPLVVQILRTDEADDAVDEKRLEDPCDPVGSCFERQLIDAVMRFGGQCTALAGFEVHNVITCPTDIPLAVMIENLFAAFTQGIHCDSEAPVGRFRTCNGLEKKVYRCTTL